MGRMIVRVGVGGVWGGDDAAVLKASSAHS